MKRLDEKILKDILFWLKDKSSSKNRWNESYEMIGDIWSIEGPQYHGPTGFIRYITEMPHIHLSAPDRQRVEDFNFDLNRQYPGMFVQCEDGSGENFYIDHHPDEWIYDQAVFSYKHNNGNMFWMAYVKFTENNTESEMLDPDRPMAACLCGLPVEPGLRVDTLFWPFIYQKDSSKKNGFDVWPLMKWANDDGSVDLVETSRNMYDQATNIMSQFTLLHHYLKHSDRHAVEVTPVKTVKYNKSLHAKRPWAGPSGPRVLLLDRIPTSGTATGEGSSKKPHMRRGHWRTLNHPRYRHHPQYQEKIWVKPAFIGPEQATYQGNHYRLVQPLEDELGLVA